jgi:hypothetical protein
MAVADLFVWLLYCWLVAGDWFVLSEKYCWLVADKPNEQSETGVLTREGPMSCFPDAE